MNENRNEYFTGVLLVIIGILSTALFIDGFYLESAIFNIFSRGFSRWTENTFGIFSIMMFSIPTIIGIVLIMGEKSTNRIFMLLGYILLASLIPPFFHKVSGNNYNAGIYGMKISELFSGSGNTAIEAAIYFLWLSLSVGFLLFPIRGKIVESIAKLLHIETSMSDSDNFDNSQNDFSFSKNDTKKYSYDFNEKGDKQEKQTFFNFNKLFGKDSKKSTGNQNIHNFATEKITSTEIKDTFVPQKSSSFKVTTRISSDNDNEEDFLKTSKKSIFQIDSETTEKTSNNEIKETEPKKSIFEILQPISNNKTSSETIPWVSKVIYESDDKRMEVPIFSKAPIKKFKMKKNEENVEEYTEVDTLSSQVYNKVAVGGESIKIADIDSKSYFAKMKDNWPESWKNTNNSCNKENKEITNSDSDLEENYNSENDNSDIIPDNLEETTEEEMLLDDITEIEKLRIVSDLEDDSVTFDNLQESFFNSNPFDSDDENEDDDFCEKQFIDNNDYEIKTSSSNIIFNDDDDDDDYWDFRKEMNEVFNNNECEKENIIERSDSIVNKNVSIKSEENNFSNNNKEPEVEENDFTSWKNTSESINTNDIKNFLNQNMESYSHFRESEKLKQNIQQPQSYFQNQNTEPANKTYNRESGLYHQAMQIRNNNHHPLPNGNLLRENTQRINPEEYKRAEAESAAILENTLAEFGIKAKVCDIIHGPVVTLFKIIPAPGIKLSKIEGLSDNLALRLAAQSIRIIAPIPGEKVVGIEVPNPKRELISFKEVINSESFANNSYQVPVGLGKDIYGKVVAIDVHKMPHILIAGATGAGKSVCVNGFLCSILFSRSPEDVKMILIDPKVVELQPYDGIPHLLTPVITDPKDAVNALKYLVYEMEERYKILGKIGVRSIVEYRKMVKEGKLSMSLMPFIICVVDEFADLMTTVGKEAEMLFARLTAKARAVGIHLVLATQRPSADVITGVIKSNVPARIAFQVISYQDSRIILDQKGAEKLLGQGDMLYLSPTQPHPVRLQGAFLDKEEVDLVVEHWKSLAEPEYIDIGEILGIEDEESFTGSGGGDGVSNDPLYEEAVEVVLQTKKASASYLQRRLSIGYNRAARLIEEMEAQGIVGPMQGSKPREVFGSAGSSNTDENYF